MRRSGELTTDSLTAAIAEESDEHGEVFTVLVAADIEARAIEVVIAPSATVDAVRSVMPRVEVVNAFEAGEWELLPR